MPSDAYSQRVPTHARAFKELYESQPRACARASAVGLLQRVLSRLDAPAKAAQVP